MKKQVLSSYLRKLYLAKIADHVRFYYLWIKSRGAFNSFRSKYPNVKLPPDYLIYESFQLNYFKYYEDGRTSAKDIIKAVGPFITLQNISILDWGCGPARILRHMPELLGPTNKYFGTDYNKKTIKWCKHNIEGVQFSRNDIFPPLDFQADSFLFIYGISVLTHLSERNQLLWAKELYRVCAPGGVVLLTTHGEAFTEKLTKNEIQDFQNNKLVSRKNVIEGHRMYAAFHPKKYMEKLFEVAGFKLLEFTSGRRVHGSYISQDQWILRK